MRCLTRDYTADMFEYLLSTEQRPATELRISALTRSCVVNWLMKVNVSMMTSEICGYKEQYGRRFADTRVYNL